MNNSLEGNKLLPHPPSSYGTAPSESPPINDIVGRNNNNCGHDDKLHVINSSNTSEQITCDEAIDHMGFGPFQLMLLLVLGVCWGCDAMEVMLLSFVVPVLREKWNLSPAEQASLNAVIFTGMLFGASFFGWLADRYGRKIGIAVSLLITSIFGVVSAFSYNIWMLGICQVLVGFGVAGSAVPFGLFTEFLPSDKRGHFLIIIEVFWTVGVMVEAGLAWLLIPEDALRLKLFHGMGWRFLIGFSAVPMIFALLCVPFLPESPRYLILHNKTEHCMSIFKTMAWWNRKPIFEATLVQQKTKVNDHVAEVHHTPSTTDLTSEYYSIQGGDNEKGSKEDEVKKKSSSSIAQMFSRHLWVTTVFVLILWFIGALGYYGVIIMTPIYFDNLVGSSGTNGVFLETFIISCAELPGLLWATLIINEIGRKKTQSLLFMSTGLFLLLLAIPSDPGNTWLMTIYAFGARASIMGATCATWTYTPEVFPTSCRTLAMGICSSTGRIGGIITPYIASILIRVYPKLPVGIYAGSCLFAAFIALLLPYETMGRKLMDHPPEKKSKRSDKNRT